MRHEVSFSLPEKVKSQSVQLLENPCQHVHKRSHVPDTGKSKCIDHQGSALERKLTLPHTGKDVLDSSDARSPVSHFKITDTDENTEDPDLGR